MADLMGLASKSDVEEVVTLEQLRERQAYEATYGQRDDVHWGLLLALLRNRYRDPDKEPVFDIFAVSPILKRPEQPAEDVGRAWMRAARRKQRQLKRAKKPNEGK